MPCHAGKIQTLQELFDHPYNMNYMKHVRFNGTSR